MENEESLSKEWTESESEDDDDETVETRTGGCVYHEPTEESSLEDESSNCTWARDSSAGVGVSVLSSSD